MVNVEWSKKAIKQLLSIDSRYRKTISDKVSQLVTFPAVELDIKKIQGCNNQYRLRVGNYRVIFEITDGKPVICTIKEVRRRTSTTY